MSKQAAILSELPDPPVLECVQWGLHLGSFPVVLRRNLITDEAYDSRFTSRNVSSQKLWGVGVAALILAKRGEKNYRAFVPVGEWTLQDDPTVPELEAARSRLNSEVLSFESKPHSGSTIFRVSFKVHCSCICCRYFF